MILKINPYVEMGTGRNCLEDVMVCAFKSMDKHYELFFSESWSFGYTTHDPLIGKRMKIKRQVSYDLLQDAHGIEVKYHKTNNSSSVLDIIRTEIFTYQSPVVIYLDLFWTAWGSADNYQKNHLDHFCLVIGINETDQVIYCIDTIFSSQVQALPYEHFFSGNDGDCATFHIHPEDCIKDWRSVFERITKKIFKFNDVQAIQKFAEDFKNHFDIRKEVEGYGELWKSSIGEEIRNVIFGRKGYYEALLFLNTKLGYLNDLIHKVNEIIIQWNIVSGLISKLYYLDQMGKTADYRVKIGGKLIEICQLEQDFMNTLSNNFLKNENTSYN